MKLNSVSHGNAVFDNPVVALKFHIFVNASSIRILGYFVTLILKSTQHVGRNGKLQSASPQRPNSGESLCELHFSVFAI